MTRTEVKRRVIRKLTQVNPQHVSVVGRKLVGKTSLMSNVYEALVAHEKFSGAAVVHWDLSVDTPQTDGEFWRQLCERTVAALPTSKEYFKGHLRDARDEESAYGPFKDVVEELTPDVPGMPDSYGGVVAICDGFDRLLEANTLSKNLYDNLRGLMQNSGFRVVTATHRSLPSLMLDLTIRASPFFNVFGLTPEVLRPLTVDELPEDRRWSGGVRTELINESGGIPWLFERLGETLSQTGKEDAVLTPRDVQQVGEALQGECNDVLRQIWHHCNEKERDQFEKLLVSGTGGQPAASSDEEEQLIRQGLARRTGGRLEKSCRLMERYVRPHMGSPKRLAQWFGDAKDAERYRDMLSFQLAQIQGGDDDYRGTLQESIELLPRRRGEKLATGNLHNLRDRAIEIVLQREFEKWGGTDTMGIDVVPGPLCSALTIDWDSHNANQFPQPVRKWLEETEQGNQGVRDVRVKDAADSIGLLRLLTGSTNDDRYNRSIARNKSTTTKDVYVLINTLHVLRNRLLHSGGPGERQEIDLHTAHWALGTAVQLFRALTPD